MGIIPILGGKVDCRIARPHCRYFGSASGEAEAKVGILADNGQPRPDIDGVASAGYDVERSADEGSCHFGSQFFVPIIFRTDPPSLA